MCLQLYARSARARWRHTIRITQPSHTQHEAFTLAHKRAHTKTDTHTCTKFILYEAVQRELRINMQYTITTQKIFQTTTKTVQTKTTNVFFGGCVWGVLIKSHSKLVRCLHAQPHTNTHTLTLEGLCVALASLALVYIRLCFSTLALIAFESWCSLKLNCLFVNKK